MTPPTPSPTESQYFAAGSEVDGAADSTAAIVAGVVGGIVIVALILVAAVRYNRGVDSHAHPPRHLSANGATDYPPRHHSHDLAAEGNASTGSMAPLFATGDGEVEGNPAFERTPDPGGGGLSAVDTTLPAANADSFCARDGAFKSVRRTNPLVDIKAEAVAPLPVCEDDDGHVNESPAKPPSKRRSSLV